MQFRLRKVAMSGFDNFEEEERNKIYLTVASKT
jgi:hypothetical protein